MTTMTICTNRSKVVLMRITCPIRALTETLILLIPPSIVFFYIFLLIHHSRMNGLPTFYCRWVDEVFVFFFWCLLICLVHLFKWDTTTADIICMDNLYPFVQSWVDTMQSQTLHFIAVVNNNVIFEFEWNWMKRHMHMYPSVVNKKKIFCTFVHCRCLIKPDNFSFSNSM